MPYTVIPRAIPDVLVLEPKVLGDSRGFFYESFNARDSAESTNMTIPFVQDNHSKSTRGVLRGLHYQNFHPQGKLVRVTEGEVLDVAVDLRKSSPTFGKGIGERLSAVNNRQLWILPGFAHGFVVLSRQRNFCIKPPITGFQSMSVASHGTIGPSPSTGRLILNHCSQKKMLLLPVLSMRKFSCETC